MATVTYEQADTISALKVLVQARLDAGYELNSHGIKVVLDRDYQKLVYIQHLQHPV